MIEAVDIGTGSVIRIRYSRAIKKSSKQQVDAADIALFDSLPAWAKDAIREAQFPVKVSEVLPAIRSGMMNRFNARQLMAQNDAMWRKILDQEQVRKYGSA